MPIASDVPRESTASRTPSAAQTARISQPAASARSSNQADGQRRRRAFDLRDHGLAIAPAANTASTNGTSDERQRDQLGREHAAAGPGAG